MKKYELEEIEKFVQKVVEKYGDALSMIILFGSACRDELSDESDIDFLIVTPKNRLELLKGITRIATPIVLEYGRPISTKVYDTDQYKYFKNLKTPFMKNIESEGKILWMKK